MNWLKRLWAWWTNAQPDEAVESGVVEYSRLNWALDDAYNNALLGLGTWAEVEQADTALRAFEQEHGL